MHASLESPARDGARTLVRAATVNPPPEAR